MCVFLGVCVLFLFVDFILFYFIFFFCLNLFHTIIAEKIGGDLVLNENVEE